MSRRIAHLDMDAFYASVELLRYPQLEGLAVVVGGPERSGYDKTTAVRDFVRLRDYAGRGVATTASYEARSLGVHSAMGLMKAATLAPDAVLLPADFAEYRRQSCCAEDPATAQILHQAERHADRGAMLTNRSARCRRRRPCRHPRSPCRDRRRQAAPS